MRLYAADQDAGTDHPCVPASTFEQAVQFDRFVSMVLE